ncbi:uncharacterized protein EI90DRAFT_3082480 [Cantharellus anzutake]|uniref:uncharacterized protein n=1 Tax=Cantharellus anzutake TaxID=1750568 RepID=UPI0019075180|nr:uncharacterized protein EI90DRAFT_3082480 [Cantharellus anzutake]KAF8319178.1 hypothetical protein EI90DRAFT_3082480 [Cantharellus anzutake]
MDSLLRPGGLSSSSLYLALLGTVAASYSVLGGLQHNSRCHLATPVRKLGENRIESERNVGLLGEDLNKGHLARGRGSNVTISRTNDASD